MVATVCDANVRLDGNNAIPGARGDADARAIVCPPTARTSSAIAASAGRNRRRRRAAQPATTIAIHVRTSDGVTFGRHRETSSADPLDAGGRRDVAVVDKVRMDLTADVPNVTVSGLKVHATPEGSVPELHVSAISLRYGPT